MSGPRVLMTIDAAGGVWRYGVDLARALAESGATCILAGMGPPPAEVPQGVLWTDQPLDWLVEGEAELDAVPRTLLTSPAPTARTCCT